MLVWEAHIKGQLKQLLVCLFRKPCQVPSCCTLNLSKQHMHSYGVKLRPYIEVHQRWSRASYFDELFGNREASNRINKWATELLEHVIDFKRRNTIKSQVLAAFVVQYKREILKPKIQSLGWYSVTGLTAMMAQQHQQSLFHLWESGQGLTQGSNSGSLTSKPQTMWWNTRHCCWGWGKWKLWGNLLS